jgi:hypothetical protein
MQFFNRNKFKPNWFDNDEWLFKKSLIYDPTNQVQFIDFVNNEEVDSIMINLAYHDPISDFSFLKEIKSIKEIRILQQIVRIDEITSLTCLESLVLSNSNCQIDVIDFPNLKSLVGKFANFKNLYAAKNVKLLTLDNVTLEDLNFCKEMRILEKLTIHFSKITSLNGIENCINLSYIDLHNNKSLINIDALGNHANLDYLSIYNSPKLGKFPSFENLKNLRKLFIQKISSLENLNFLINTNLNYLVIGASVSEINSDYIKNVPNILIPKYEFNTLK